ALGRVAIRVGRIGSGYSDPDDGKVSENRSLPGPRWRAGIVSPGPRWRYRWGDHRPAAVHNVESLRLAGVEGGGTGRVGVREDVSQEPTCHPGVGAVHSTGSQDLDRTAC